MSNFPLEDNLLRNFAEKQIGQMTAHLPDFVIEIRMNYSVESSVGRQLPYPQIFFSFIMVKSPLAASLNGSAVTSVASVSKNAGVFSLQHLYLTNSWCYR